jgi:hypothetical protein
MWVGKFQKLTFVTNLSTHIFRPKGDVGGHYPLTARFDILMMTLSFERTDTRIADSDASKSVHPSPGIPEESKLVAGG